MKSADAQNISFGSLLYKIAVAGALIVYCLWRLPGLLRLSGSVLLLGRYVSLWFGLPVVLLWSLGESSFKSYLFLILMISGVEYWFRSTLIPISYVYVWLLAAIAVVKSAITKQRVFTFKMMSPWFIAYAAFAAIEYLRDPVTPTWGLEMTTLGARPYFVFFSLILFVVICPHIFRMDTLLRLPRMIVTCGVIVVMIQVAIYVSGDPQLGLLFGVKPKEWSLAAIVEGRWAFLHQGAILIFISSLAMWHAAKTTGRGTRRWPLMALAALAFVALLFTGTRAWVFGAIVVAIYFLALERRYLTISAGVGVGLLVALICSNIRIPSENGLAPIVRSFSIPWFNFSGAERSVHAGGSWNWRVDLWKLALDQIKRTPLWGAGFRLDPYVRSVLTSTYVARNRSYYNYLINLASGSTHQLWLGPFHTFGVLGGLLFLIYYIERVAAAWKLAVTTCRERSEYAGSALFIAAWLIYGTAIGFVDGGTTAMRFYIPAGLSHLLAYAVNNKIEKPSAGPPAEAAGGSKAIESQ